MDISVYEKRLRQRQSELSARLEKIERDFEKPYDPDEEDLATEFSNDDVLDSLGQQGEAELRAVDAALQRVADGIFGTCTRCGREISPKRLDAVPYTPFCEDCAHEIEGK